MNTITGADWQIALRRARAEGAAEGNEALAKIRAAMAETNLVNREPSVESKANDAAPSGAKISAN